jgi:hypothetical protein
LRRVSRSKGQNDFFIAGTPDETVLALQKQITAVIQQPAIKQKLIDFGIELAFPQNSRQPCPSNSQRGRSCAVQKNKLE